MRNVNEAGRHLCPQAVCSGERLLSAWAWGAGDEGRVCEPCEILHDIPILTVPSIARHKPAFDFASSVLPSFQRRVLPSRSHVPVFPCSQSSCFSAGWADCWGCELPFTPRTKATSLELRA